MKTIAFRLSMPRNNSWNNRWSGEELIYVRVQALTNTIAQRVLQQGYYSHSFGDGWVAMISVEEVSKEKAKELKKKSKGFCGYDWMIDNIKWYGDASGNKGKAA